jgi:hypothetical protein
MATAPAFLFGEFFVRRRSRRDVGMHAQRQIVANVKIRRSSAQTCDWAAIRETIGVVTFAQRCKNELM